MTHWLSILRRAHRTAALITATFFFLAVNLLAAQQTNYGIEYDCPSCREKPHFWVTLGQTVGLNIGLNLFNRVINGEEFAVGPASWRRNLSKGWEFDDNNFGMNQFAHPYNGAVYFNSARSNGYDFWSSIPFVALGSFLWEYFGETHRPALNDFVSTTFGGIALGEATFQLSTLLLDNTLRGRDRTWREIAALAVNPARGVNRLAFGDWNRIGPNSPTRRPERLRGLLQIGVGVVEGDGSSDGEVRPVLIFDAGYGDMLTQPYLKPFDSFTFRAHLGASDVPVVREVQAVGRLYVRPLSSGGVPRHALIVTQNYDYVDQLAYRLAGQSIEAGILSRFPVAGRTDLRTALTGRTIILGAVNSEFQSGPLRDYDFGPGLGFTAVGAIVDQGHSAVTLRYNFQWIHNVNGLAGDHVLRIGSVELNLPITEGLSVGGSALRYSRSSHYRTRAASTAGSTHFLLHLTRRL